MINPPKVKQHAVQWRPAGIFQPNLSISRIWWSTNIETTRIFILLDWHTLIGRHAKIGQRIIQQQWSNRKASSPPEARFIFWYHDSSLLVNLIRWAREDIWRVGKVNVFSGGQKAQNVDTEKLRFYVLWALGRYHFRSSAVVNQIT